VLDRAFCQVRESEAQALFGIYRAEAEAKGGEDVLRRVAAVLTRTFRAKAARVLTGPDLDRRLRRLLFIRRGTPGARLIADARMRKRYRSFWSCPLDDSAVLQLGFAVNYPWLPRERLLLEIAAERCRGALERVRLEAEIHRLAAEARCAEEEERRRIGRELHDETGQSLLALRLQLELMEKEAQGTLGARLKEARTLVEGTIVELRRLMAALSPTAVERLGMASSLRHLVSRFRKMHPAVMRVRMKGPVEAIPKQIQAVVYRVAQECLQNIIKHSQAGAINLSLNAADKHTGLRVSDNGTGFPGGVAAGKPMSFGLAGMRERAALLGGTLGVTGAPGKGTTVILELPRNAAMVAENVKNSCTVD
jgi:signal transduction histidine kinase